MTESEPVRAASRERVLDVLRAQGYRITELADGALAGAWDGNTFTIALVGSGADVLQIRGSWHGSIDPTLEGDLGQMVNDWNRDRIWPKVYTRRVDDTLRVHAETCFDLGDGVTDAQLVEFLSCGLGTGVQFFETMASMFGR